MIKKKMGIFIIWIVLTLISASIIVIFEAWNNAIVVSFAGVVFPVLFDKAWNRGEDLFDTTDWKVSQRKLIRGKLIKDDELVRISFAYLYRIKVGNEYLLIMNSRGTDKYQPVGGVYKLKDDERVKLNNLFHVVDDNKVKLDESSRDDYRLLMPSKYLRKFVKRFNNDKVQREKINDVSREFKEELGEYVAWNKIRYRYCGRHMTELKYGDHFQCYELLLADIVELMPYAEQMQDLQELKKKRAKQFRFADSNEIKSLGINTGTGKLKESIADHSAKILQENEQYLMKIKGVGNIYEVRL